APAAGGAEDGPTWLRIFPQMKEGVLAATPHPCHGPKLALRAPEGPFTADGLDFPNTAPLSLVRLGGALLAATPFEMTTVVGYRIREELAALTHPDRPGDDDVILVGLTNSYLQYVTTADEYALQHYEGASTLYGPHTAAFLAHHLTCLARALHGAAPSTECDLDQQSALNRTYPVAQAPDHVARMPGPPAKTALPPTADLPVAHTLDDLWHAYLVRFDGPPLDSTRPTFSVRIIDAAGALLDDDHGTAIEVRQDRPRPGAPDAHRWRVRWTPHGSPAARACGLKARFEIDHGRKLRSRLFTVDCRPPLTTRPEDPRLPPPPLPPTLIPPWSRPAAPPPGAAP
ncbi:MAG TPA: neutral/alkaline non-lysosomal ceramidase N-terminal domain-containing protein, partial [Candidatus Nanopelagicales bacterium]|nr:neutral/alkaline non-lysosomal ceramidase N-terminal domain-containing protein [Candidatus Nanopelagicales bacterium]